ncbi:MAG: NADH-quinone oxidoreductase subunit NuoF [Chloroflexi bacterium]|nr:NADH-quinone oxidoreductase subunit NuoF [Chloroflexota bacterium]
MADFERVLTRNVGVPNAWEIDVYRSRGGYRALPKALKALTPQAVTDLVKASGLRGRGGAGFPTGRKWDFVPKDPKLQKYVICNADESEPGTFNNRELIEWDPHQVVEGIALACYAVGASQAYIYCRGEFFLGADRLERAVAQARAAGLLGRNILSSGVDVEIGVFRGAGAYICGEETALLESLEGNRPMPRSRPPFPAIAGLYGKPTVVNNVETLCNVPHIVERGAEWYTAIGRPNNSGPKVFSLSGHVRRPGNYELPLGTTIRDLIYEHGGGVPGDRRVKAVVPGGASAAMLTEASLDLSLDFDTMMKNGTMLGTGGVVVMDETVCIPHLVLREEEFFSHESCGKCTPCREGTRWMVQVLRRIVTGRGRMEDVTLLADLCDNIGGGKTLCALGDAAIGPVSSGIRHFRDEFEYHIRHGRCPTAGQEHRAP